TGSDLALDVRAHDVLGFANALFVLGAAAVESLDVVPGAHDESIVDRDGTLRRMWKYETNRRRARQAELGHDRHEIVAVGAQAMQPNDGRGRRSRRVEDDGGIGFLGGVVHSA